MPLSQVQPRIVRSLQLALFATSITWVVAANLLAGRAARGLVVRFQWSDEYLLLDAIFFLFLLTLGFAILQAITTPGSPLRETLGVPRRRTSRMEWSLGVAIGWALIVFAVLPMALGRALHIRFWVDSRSLSLAGLNLVTVAILALAVEAAFRGYPYRRLIGAIGPVGATILLSVVYGITATMGPESTLLSTAIATLLGAVLCTAWLRTHAIWLGWGLHFAWIASLGVLFGLPVAGVDNLSSLVESRAIGPRWLTGGDLGPEGALLTPLLLVASIAVVVLVSRDFAWDYTRKPLIPAGYPMDVPPPAEHEAMESHSAAAAPAPALVQILPTTPLTMSRIPLSSAGITHTASQTAAVEPESSANPQG